VGKFIAPDPVKIVVSIIYRDPSRERCAVGMMSGHFGPVDFESPETPFDYSDYYVPEMGSPLRRRFIAFQRLFSRNCLAGVKRFSNHLEDVMSVEGKRTVNLDPGILSLDNFILATTKRRAHRIYLGANIYADLTLVYESGSFKSLSWTYRDYGSAGIIQMFGDLRQRYKKQLREKV